MPLTQTVHFPATIGINWDQMVVPMSCMKEKEQQGEWVTEVTGNLDVVMVVEIRVERVVVSLVRLRSKSNRVTLVPSHRRVAEVELALGLAHIMERLLKIDEHATRKRCLMHILAWMKQTVMNL
jgi:hypothetical protein